MLTPTDAISQAELEAGDATELLPRVREVLLTMATCGYSWLLTMATLAVAKLTMATRTVATLTMATLTLGARGCPAGPRPTARAAHRSGAARGGLHARVRRRRRARARGGSHALCPGAAAVRGIVTSAALTMAPEQLYLLWSQQRARAYLLWPQHGARLTVAQAQCLCELLLLPGYHPYQAQRLSELLQLRGPDALVPAVQVRG